MTQEMNMDRAKMIIWNPETYGFETVMQASIYVLGSLNAHPEDVEQAKVAI